MRIDELVEPTRVNSQVYCDPAVFEEEFDKIWSKTWIYVAHESEVPEPGDYLRRRVGRDELIVTRGEDDVVRVLKNRCIHRGNTVCQLECGNAKIFRCSYHGWTYGNDGRLIGVTFKSGRGGYKDELLATLKGLEPPARVDSYRGLVFASLSPDVPSLKEFLGGAAYAIDRFIDLAPGGEIELSTGSQRLVLHANWKMWAENSVDRYHATFVHQAAFVDSAQNKFEAQASSDRSAAVVRVFDGGHSELDFRPERWAFGKPVYTSGVGRTEQDFPELVQALEARIGKEHANRLLVGGPPHLLVFPNLFFLQQDIRFVLPVAPTRSHVYHCPAMLKGASPELNALRLRRHERAYGPAGSVIPDDLEIFERNQQALAGEPSWLLLERGAGEEWADEEGYTVGHLSSELTQRSFWKEYARRMA